MRRVLVVGGTGAGKSTFAQRLGVATGLPVVHLDLLWWRPGWIEAPRAEFDAAVAAVASGNAWIIDGNYTRTFDARIARADTVVVLDLGWPLRLWRVIRRVGRPRPDLPEGCVERWATRDFLSFLRWTVWHWPRVSRPKLRRALAVAGAAVDVYWFRSRLEAERFLRRLESS